MSKLVPETITKFAITTSKTQLQMHFSKDTPNDALENFRDNKVTVAAGTLLKVFQTTTASATKYSTVQVLDFVHPSPIYENSLFECLQVHMRKVSEDLWPYLISINESDRLNFLRDQEHCRWVIYLKPKDFVSVAGDTFGKESFVRYDCIIRYIGPVEELQSVGYYFGLELLNLDYGYSPQEEKIPFASKYTNAEPRLSIFVTANKLLQLSSEAKKKFSALDFISETVDKVKNAITPNICVQTNTSSLKREKKYKQKQPTSQFYDTQLTPTALVDDLSFETGKADELKATSSTGTMERRVQVQQKTNVNTVESNPTISLEGDDYRQSIENYEKTLERQYAGKNTSTAQNIQQKKGKSNPSDQTNIPTAAQPAGILKHRRQPTDNKDDTAKASTILSLYDRDIVVIDKADIQNATKNESSVVVVDKQRAQQEVDLAELLGSNWPNTAGDAASILNKAHKQSSNTEDYGTATKNERNKSSNLLTHFGMKSSQERSNRTAEKINPTWSEVVSGSSNEPKKSNFELPTTVASSTPPPPLTSTKELELAESSPLQEVPDTGLGVGSMVEISVPESSDLYGVIRWIGVPPGANNVMVGVELEDENTNKDLLATDGTFNGFLLFKCNEGRALFVSPENCSSDKRFLDADGAVGCTNKLINNYQENSSDSKMFGQVECPSVPGAVAPLKILSLEDLEEICGKFKGIQGHHNSCYLDATLFSMFTFTSVFDSLLFRPQDPEDISNYSEVQKVLREEIVNPLRKNMFVRADRVMKLRQHLDRLSSVSGLMSEEKDPEEFLNSLLAQIMRVEPFLKLSSGQDAYFYQLFVEKDERLSFPSVQQLFEQSFHSSDIKLKEVPSCLIIQMPRFGKNFKMYPRILPSQVLDVTDIIEDSPRQCSVCGKLAEYECRNCFGNIQSGAGLESTAFCGKCSQTVHTHAKRVNHTPKKLCVPQDFRIMADHMQVPRLYMELFAVVCIETSHYVAFVKAGCGPDAPWCFFDSMADRKGEQNGYNIPEMITVPDMPQWLSEEGARIVNETSSNDKMLPEHAKRLFCDAYMCMYQSTDVMMYR